MDIVSGIRHPEDLLSQSRKSGNPPDSLLGWGGTVLTAGSVVWGFPVVAWEDARRQPSQRFDIEAKLGSRLDFFPSVWKINQFLTFGTTGSTKKEACSSPSSKIQGTLSCLRKIFPFTSRACLWKHSPCEQQICLHSKALQTGSWDKVLCMQIGRVLLVCEKQ